MGLRLTKRRDATPADPSASDFVRAVPIEVTLSIISYLSDSDLARVCRVCKSWKYIAADEHLILRFALSHFLSCFLEDGGFDRRGVSIASVFGVCEASEASMLPSHWSLDLSSCGGSWKKAYQKAVTSDLVPQHVRRIVDFLSQPSALTTADLFKKRVSSHDPTAVALVVALEKAQWKKVVLQDLGSGTMTCYHEAAALLALSLERQKEPVLSAATCTELCALAEAVSGDRGEMREVQRKITTVLVEGSRSPSSRSPVGSPNASSPSTSPPLSPRSAVASATESVAKLSTTTPLTTASSVTPPSPVVVPAQLKKHPSASKVPIAISSNEGVRLQQIVSSLSPAVYLHLQFLIRFFVRVCSLGDLNRTSVKKLCRLFGVLIIHGNSHDSTRLVQEAFAAPVALRLLIENYVLLFGDSNRSNY